MTPGCLSTVEDFLQLATHRFEGSRASTGGLWILDGRAIACGEIATGSTVKLLWSPEC